MKDKYVEEDFPLYMEFGIHADGRVDIETTNGDPVATVSKAEAATIIKHRAEVVQRLCDMARAFDEAAPEAFTEFWYGKGKN